MTKALPRDSVFITGAGASLGSGLPDGAALATRTFDLLINSGTVVAEARALAKIRVALQHELRLETFLEVLAGEVSAEIAFRPFASMERAAPCFAPRRRNLWVTDTLQWAPTLGSREPDVG